MIIERSRYFSKEELQCKCGCGRAEMDSEFMEDLDNLREASSRPMLLNSAFRCPEHNDAVSSTGRDGPHTTGKAVDIRVSGAQCYELLHLALASRKFIGIGVSQKGDRSSRFLHLDQLTSGSRPWVWSY